MALLSLLSAPLFLQPVAQDAVAQPLMVHALTVHMPIPVTCRTLACAQKPDALVLADKPIRPPLPGQPRRGRQLRAPSSASQALSGEFNSARLGARWGVQALADADTSLRFELGGGLRWQPYADNGSASQGLVARGMLDLQHKVSTSTRINQRTWFETGASGARYVRSALGLTWQLQPNLSWQTEVELRHHALQNGRDKTHGEGRTRLNYRF